MQEENIKKIEGIAKTIDQEFLLEGTIKTEIEDDEEESDIDSWIYPTTNGGLDNWTAKDFVPISFITQ